MDTVELKPTRRWPTQAMAAHFEREEQGEAFANLTKGAFITSGPVPHVLLPAMGVIGPAPQRLLVGDWLVRHHSSMWERLTDAIYRERYEPPSEELVPLADMVNTLPDPTSFRRRIMAAARERYATLVTEQGDIRDAADTYAAHRDLAATREVVDGIASALRALSKEIGTFQQDQLERLPSGLTERLTVPDAAGDLTVSMDTYNEHTIDVTELQAAVCATVLDNVGLDYVIELIEDADSEYAQRENLSGALAGLVMAAQVQLAELGKFEPQVTKVREFAKQQARTGADGLAAIIAGTIGTKRKARDAAKFTRKEQKS